MFSKYADISCFYGCRNNPEQIGLMLMLAELGVQATTQQSKASKYAAFNVRVISKIMGPKKQDFFPRINMLKGKKIKKVLLMNYGSSKSTKIVL
jgi:inhibitor of KinA sporulation pathway (predicted exonuclease)